MMVARISKETIDAMNEVRKLKRTPYDIALEIGISPSTLYRSTLYKKFKEECAQKGIELPISTVPDAKRPQAKKNAAKKKPAAEAAR